MQKTQITEAGDAFIITGATDAQRIRLKAAMNEPAPERIELLTRREAGKILNLHPLSLKRYDKAGILHPIRLTSKTVRYSRGEVLGLLK
jgi:hypothetical protein